MSLFLPVGIVQQQAISVGGGGPSSLLTDLVSWWTLDETAANIRVDSHGVNHLADNYTMQHDTGKISNAAKYTRTTGNYLSKAATHGLEAGDRDFSVAGWVKLGTDSLVSMAGVGQYGSSAPANNDWALWRHTSSSGYFRFTVADSSFHTLLASTFGTPSLATWYFLYAYYDSVADEMGISVNDGTVDTVGSITAPNDTGNIFLLGGNLTGAGDYDGLMDEMAFWTKVLTADEVTELYNAGAGITHSDLHTDSDFASVTLLLHCDGVDASTAFPDNSDSSHTATANGDAQVDTAQSKFGGASALFDGTGDDISIPYVTGDFDWFSADHTIEMWVRTASSWTGWEAGTPNFAPAAIGRKNPTSTINYWSFGPLDDGTLEFYYYNGAAQHVTTTTTISTGAWVHVAMTYVHSTGDIRLFIGGTLEKTLAKSGTPQSVSQNLNIGELNNVSINGWLDDIRITQGVARYTTSFTPPTLLFPNNA